MKTTRSYLVRWATLVLMVGIGVAVVVGTSGSDERAAVPTDALGEIVATPQPTPQSVAALMDHAVEDAIQLDRQSLALHGPGYALARGADGMGSAADADGDVDGDVNVAWLEDVIAEVAQRAERSRRRPCGAALRI